MINFIQKSKIQKFLRGRGFQIKAPVYQTIDNIVGKLLESLIEGAQSEQIKSIGTDDVIRFIGVKTKKKSSDVLANNDTSCKRCGTIKKPFLEFAKKLQVFTIEEAKIMASKYM